MSVLEQYQVAGRSAREIADSFERAVREERIAPGERLPTIRSLAEELGTSPATVAAAYRVLHERGLVAGDGRRGTRVTPRPALRARVDAPLPADVRDLTIGLPDPELLPDVSTVLGRLPGPGREAVWEKHPNDPRLLAMAAEQFRADGIEPGPLAVVGGALDGIERVLAAHLGHGDRVALEDPSYSRIHDLIAAAGYVEVPVAIDDRGLIPESLREALAAGVRAVLLTPRAQNPTGAALDAERAAELRAVLAGHDVLLLEDDHAAGIADLPAFSLAADHPRWAIVRSVSKALHPDLRLAILTGDETTIARVEGRQALGTGWVSTILQQAVAALWTDPDAQRAVARARAAYAERRNALLDALVAESIAAQGRTGLNVWIPVREETSTARALLAAGWAVSAGERYRVRAAPAVRVTIATLLPEEAPRLAADIAATQRPATHVRGY
jgi:DNA-binding transcriptional MocR family regulator